MMFDIYTQEVKIKDASGNEFTYELKPLTGKYLPKLYEVMQEMSGTEEFDNSKMNEKTMSALHEIAFETMRKSYPKEDEDRLNMWVLQNLLKLLEPILKVNVNSDVTAE